MLGNKYRTRDLESLRDVIKDIAKDEIKKNGFPTYRAAIVQKVNDDGTVDVYLPPNRDILLTNVLNKCGEALYVGDSVEIETKSGSLTNSWVALKHGTNVEGNADQLTKLAGEVVLKVEGDRIVTTTLERDASLGTAFTIVADNINLDGMNIVLNGTKGITITSPYFNVTKEGSITATAGKIGGWSLGATRLYSGTGANYVGLDSGTSGVNYAIWAGNDAPGSAPFRVTRAGAVTCSNLTVTGGSITLGQNFTVTTAGALTASQATITGTITANAGTIGGCSIVNGTLNVAAANVTSGTFNEARIPNLSAGKITSGTMSADRIYGGTINGNNVNITNLSASNITSGSMSASRITSGTMSAARISGGTISASNLTCGNYVKIYSGGHLELTNNAGFFAMGPGYGSVPDITHPYVSALNICRGGGTGVTFRSSQSITSTGTSVGYIRCYQDTSRGATNQMNIYADDGVEMASSNGCNIYLWSKIELNANGSASVWASGNNLSSGRVQTSEGQASSRILKEKITPFKSQDYDEAYQLLKSIDICSYDYKYKLYKDKHQYGFIIDDLEALPNYDKFFKLETLYAKVSDNGTIDPSVMDEENFDKENLGEDIIEYKEYDSNVLDKYLLTCLKALQQKVDYLEKQLGKEE